MNKVWILLLCVLMLTGCAGTNTQNGLQELDVVLDWYPNALHAFLYTAMDKGYFEEEGIRINIRFPSNSNDAISLVAAGQADIGLYYQQDVIQTVANQDVPIKSIGALVRHPMNIVLSLKDKGIETPRDLEGKTVGYAGTELSEALIRTMMEYAGADFSQTTLMDVGFDLMSSMTTGNVDATIGCFVNHEVPQMEEEGFEVSYFTPNEYGVPDYYEICLLANDKKIAEDREVLGGFLRACEKGFRDVKADPAAALDALMEHQNAENFPLTRSVEEKSMGILLSLMETQDGPFLSQTDTVWQENVEWMLEEGLIERELAPGDLWVDIR